MRVRRARSADREAIAAFTTDTFEWGDYVLDALDRWLADETGVVYVAVDDDDRAIGVARGTLLSPTEAWFQATRVHPEQRRRGVASLLGAALIEWARERGALVARLAIEDWNSAALAQVEGLGMRPVAVFARAVLNLGTPRPSTDGNGGRRARADIRLVPAPAPEADTAFMSWSSSELNRAGRGLFVLRWTWRRLTVEDLRAAARGEALWSARGGWALAAAADDVMEVAWCDAAPDTAEDVARALGDLAEDRGSATVVAMVPSTPWMEEAFTKTGYEVSRLVVFALGL